MFFAGVAVGTLVTLWFGPMLFASTRVSAAGLSQASPHESGD